MAVQTRSVGRPRTFDEDAVLEQALEVFWTRGYRGATARVLEAELGVTQSSIFNAFGSKRELLGRALDRYQLRIDRQLVAPLDEPGADLATLDRFVQGLLGWISSEGHNGCLLLNLLAETADADTELVARAADYRDRLRTAFGAVLIAHGSDAAQAASRADLLLAAVLGMNIAARAGASDHELASLAASIRTQIAGW